ncbi:MAG: hypothetical protein WA126_02600, partial [Thermodesulfovibrionales bacterium]
DNRYFERSEKQGFPYLKNKIQEIIEELEEVYVIVETNKGASYNPHRLVQEIKLAQKSFEKMESKLKKISNQDKVSPDYGLLYILAKEKLEKVQSPNSYQNHINALGAKYLSEEAFFFIKKIK